MAAYNGGWTGYTQTSAYFGVSYSAYMAVAIRFTAPSYSGIPSSLTIQVPVALHWSDDSGAMPCYYSLTKTDPTTLGTVYAASSPGTDSGRIASGTASITGSTSSVFYWTFTISLSALTSGGTYYLVLGANGTSYNAYAYANSTYAVTGTLTYSYPASQPTLSASSFNMGSSVTIYTNRADSSYTHTITYTFGSASGTIGTGVGASISWTPDISLANQIPNATAGLGTITCKTYAGSTLYGTTTVGFTLNVPTSIAPTISSFTASRVDNGVPSDWGIYVRGVSKATLVTTASGVYSSTIKSYTLTGGLSGASVAPGTLSPARPNTWTVTVTDSRGRTASKSVSVTVVDYSAPTISGAAFERCDADGTPNDDGVCIRAKAGISISSCSGLNSYTAEVQYKLQTSSTWISAGSYDTSGTAQVYSVSLTDSAYDVRLLVTDAIQSVYAGATLDIGTVVMEYDPDNDYLHIVPKLVLDGSLIRTLDGSALGFYKIPALTAAGCSYDVVANNWSSLPDGAFIVRMTSSYGPPYAATAYGYRTGNYGAYLYMDYIYTWRGIYQNGSLYGI